MGFRYITSVLVIKMNKTIIIGICLILVAVGCLSGCTSKEGDEFDFDNDFVEVDYLTKGGAMWLDYLNIKFLLVGTYIVTIGGKTVFNEYIEYAPYFFSIDANETPGMDGLKLIIKYNSTEVLNVRLP